MAENDPFGDGIPLADFLRRRALALRDEALREAAPMMERYNRRVRYELARMLGESPPSEPPPDLSWVSEAQWNRVRDIRRLRSMTGDEAAAHYAAQVRAQVRAEGRAGTIKATVIRPDGSEARLAETWWRGSQAEACLAGEPHPEGDVRLRDATRHEVNTSEARKVQALAWLRQNYRGRRERGEPYDKAACRSAFRKATGVTISDRGFGDAWRDFVEEATSEFPDINRGGRKGKAKSAC